MPVSNTYTDYTSFGPLQSRRSTWAAHFAPESERTYSLAFALRSHGCAVYDDRAALKQQIKDASDIADVVGRYISLRPLGPTFKGICPFHDDHRPSFDVDPRRQRYRCWSCGKHGDVFDFVQEFEKISFPEALELLARQAGISLEKIQKNPQGPSRAGMLDVMRWAGKQFQECYLESDYAKIAREYIGERKLTGETVRAFGLGYAPPEWDWLVRKAANSSISADLLEIVGLIGKRKEGKGYYDRFRDRVIFPIRDQQGRIVAFGGRILPSSSVSADQPQAKYINSAETLLFKKSEQLYGFDLARDFAAKVGYLAVVEGYTDVMMAHQHGVGQVAATMGTALNECHIRTLKQQRVPRVVLVFDADAGGESGVDRAMKVFVLNDIDLRVATLPNGLDPCDLLTSMGSIPFRTALEESVDVFELKIQRVAARMPSNSIDGRRQAAEELLTFVALTPQPLPKASESPKVGLMVNRIAQRFHIKEDLLWSRLKELRANRRTSETREAPRPSASAPSNAQQASEPQTARAARHEIELLELLLAEPSLVPGAAAEIPPGDVEHPGLRKVIEALYSLQAEGQPPDLDHLQPRLDNERVWEKCRELYDRGLDYPDRPFAFQKVLTRFRERSLERRKQAILTQLQGAVDDSTNLDLLRQLRDLTSRGSH